MKAGIEVVTPPHVRVPFSPALEDLLAHGCLVPRHPDEVHLFHDLHALIQVEPTDDVSTGLPRGALLVSSLRTTAPLILLNVSIGACSLTIPWRAAKAWRISPVMCEPPRRSPARGDRSATGGRSTSAVVRPSHA